jgi:hypothetical protein
MQPRTSRRKQSLVAKNIFIHNFSKPRGHKKHFNRLFSLPLRYKTISSIASSHYHMAAKTSFITSRHDHLIFENLSIVFFFNQKIATVLPRSCFYMPAPVELFNAFQGLVTAITQATENCRFVVSLLLQINHTSFCLLICLLIIEATLSNGCLLDVVRGPSTPHDPESNAGGSLSSWQGHPSR